jgi:hypothetical protein
LTKTQIAPKRSAWRFQALPQRIHEVVCDHSMVRRSAGHRHGLKSIELVAKFLPAFPFQEFFNRHRFALRHAHAVRNSTSERRSALTLPPC